eukprot:3816552-Amphidinium_carterae.1
MPNRIGTWSKCLLKLISINQQLLFGKGQTRLLPNPPHNHGMPHFALFCFKAIITCRSNISYAGTPMSLGHSPHHAMPPNQVLRYH